MTDEFQTKWDGYIEIDQSDPNKGVNYISEHLINAANKAKIKFVRKTIRMIPLGLTDLVKI